MLREAASSGKAMTWSRAPVTVLSVLVGRRHFLRGGLWSSLVYDYQINVESVGGSTVWDQTEADQNPPDHAGSD
jgi:hypothetical protein